MYQIIIIPTKLGGQNMPKQEKIPKNEYNEKRLGPRIQPLNPVTTSLPEDKTGKK